ncbi:putative Heat shock 70 kDa protein C [Hypsibius exemplaris]|uniref:Hypoxia up-regulated protein 1 n=1 Tax=Hypsibius exemplaris TaxID=2072580 RepID=A0A1W0X9G6_HYPEX|nr:putative Heat shock 70 kDa protein C [Hypsibius exemplaris]
MSDAVLGIDLGTSYIRCAIWDRGTVRMLTFGDGETKLPAYITINPDDNKECIIGAAGKDLSTSHPESCLFQLIHFVGCAQEQADEAVRGYHLPFQFEAVSTSNDVARFSFNFSSQHLSLRSTLCRLLRESREQAEHLIRRPIQSCVLAAPLHVAHSREGIAAVEEAAMRAGFTTVSTVPAFEAILAGCLSQSLTPGVIKAVAHLVVVDFGAESTRVRVFKMDSEGRASGITQVRLGPGGLSLDLALMQYCVSTFQKQASSSTMELDAGAIHRLRIECEEAKIKLSTAQSFQFHLPMLSHGRDFVHRLSMAVFTEICGPFVQTIDKRIYESILAADLRPDGDNFRILLVGGGARMPLLRQLIRWSNGHTLDNSLAGFADTACAYGAACLGVGEVLREKPKKERSCVLC